MRCGAGSCRGQVLGSKVIAVDHMSTLGVKTDDAQADSKIKDHAPSSQREEMSVSPWAFTGRDDQRDIE